jgi:hypothetical protein
VPFGERGAVITLALIRISAMEISVASDRLAEEKRERHNAHGGTFPQQQGGYQGGGRALGVPLNARDSAIRRT